MNLEASVLKVVKGLGILDKSRALPFVQGAAAGRQGAEDVRPIFWSNRPQSYLQKTHTWDEFPNGRWGQSRSPAFGEGFVSYSKKFKSINIENKKRDWGETCTSLDQVAAVFVSFITGKIKKFPFAEGAIALETADISDVLVKMNQNKLLTINSQPPINGVASADPKYGWGPENGYCYQKAYFEFFLPAGLLEPLVAHLSAHPQITYQAVNAAGEKV